MPTDKSQKPTKKSSVVKARANSPKVSRSNGSKKRGRTEKLFSDIEVLATQEPADARPPKRIGKDAETVEIPAYTGIPEGVGMQHELEILRMRVQELESRLRKSGRTKAVPMLYEKEQIGYSYTGETLEPLRISNWEEGFEARNAIRAPLTATGQNIGAMYIKAPSERTWLPEEENLANAVAQRVSQQIQNLRLLESAERARAEAEAATRRFMHESWGSYLDAIHQNERIGYAYDQASVTPFLEDAGSDGGYRESVKVMDEQVGTLTLKDDPTRPLTDDDKKLVSAIADQIAQQVENIRLLADASRARAEAEEATRQLTHESWQDYAARREDDTFAFAYDTVKVSPLGDSTLPENVTLTVPLEVRGEAVGQLVVAGQDKPSPEMLELAESVAAQASIHLETLRLTEELQRRAEELQELDRLKSGFLANMSHELRTPLNSILGFSDVILLELDGPLTPEMNNDLQLIQKNGQHLLHLINDVLDMAKIESGRMNLHPENFKVHDVLDEVRSITSTLASEKNISLFIEEDSDQEVEILADNTRIRQVMINLVNNAIKFTEKGRVTIRAQMQEETVLITVKDTGVGIPEEKLEDIFQEFTQVDTSTTRKVGGTGLGLPISRRLIEMHGGRLWAESTGVEGEGSSFFVELPLEARVTEVVEKTEK
jgi:signal transduction histidine kinase